MPKSNEDKKRYKEVQKASRAELERGGIPILAKERIEAQLKSGSKFFSSDLSVKEYLLTREQNIVPIGQVMGTAFFNISLFGSFFRVRLKTGEMTSVSQALLQARHKAIERLKEEARLMGANGVIGVKVNAGTRSWSSSLREFTAVGTAVKIPGWPRDRDVFVCDLSGQEFWQLLTSGYRPVSLAFGICSYYVFTTWATQRQMYSWWGGNQNNNQEIELLTQSFYDARHLVMGHLKSDLNNSAADGIVGVQVDYDLEHIPLSEKDRTQWDMIIHMTAIGTGVIEDRDYIPFDKEKLSKLSPQFCINLADKKLASAKPSRLRELDSEIISFDALKKYYGDED